MCRADDVLRPNSGTLLSVGTLCAALSPLRVLCCRIKQPATRPCLIDLRALYAYCAATYATHTSKHDRVQIKISCLHESVRMTSFILTALSKRQGAICITWLPAAVLTSSSAGAAAPAEPVRPCNHP